MIKKGEEEYYQPLLIFFEEVKINASDGSNKKEDRG